MLKLHQLVLSLLYRLYRLLSLLKQEQSVYQFISHDTKFLTIFSVMLLAACSELPFQPFSNLQKMKCSLAPQLNSSSSAIYGKQPVRQFCYRRNVFLEVVRHQELQDNHAVGGCEQKTDDEAEHFIDCDTRTLPKQLQQHQNPHLEPLWWSFWCQL